MGNITDLNESLKYNQNNLYGVTVDIKQPGATSSLIKKYRCLKTGENFTRPFATFDNIQDNINFVKDYYSEKMSTYFTAGLSKEETINKIIELFI